MFKVVEKEWKLILIVANQVENQLLLEPFTQLPKEPIFLLKCSEVVLKARIQILQHHFNLTLLQRPRTFDFGNLHKEQLGRFKQLKFDIGNLGFFSIREDSSKLLTEVREKQLRADEQEEGINVLVSVGTRDVSVSNCCEGCNHIVNGSQVLSFIVSQIYKCLLILEKPSLKLFFRGSRFDFFE